MGRTNYEAIGLGMTEREAYNNAVEDDRRYNGHQEGYSGTIGSSDGENDKAKCLVKPVPAKRCSVEKPVQKGARKWVTKFIVRPLRYQNYGEYAEKDTQGEAIKEAKAMALRVNDQVDITIVKQLASGSNVIAKVYPKKSVMGKWLFTGMARE